MNQRLRAVLLAAALTLAMPPGDGLSALETMPCQAQPILASTLPATDAQDRPLGLEDVLGGPGSRQDSGKPPLDVVHDDEDARRTFGQPLMNFVHCAQWGDPDVLASLVTGDYRATAMGINEDESGEDWFAFPDNTRVLRIIRADTADPNVVSGVAEILVDNERLLVVAMTFVEVDSEWYLDDSDVISAEDVDSTIEITLTDEDASISHSVIGSQDTVVVRLENESETTLNYVLVPAGDSPPSRIDATTPALREGLVWSYNTTDVSNVSWLAIYDLEPGMYALVFTSDRGDEQGRDPIVLRIEVE